MPLLLNPLVPASSWKPAVFSQCTQLTDIIGHARCVSLDQNIVLAEARACDSDPRCSGTSAPCRSTSGPLTPMEFPTNNACTFDNATERTIFIAPFLQYGIEITQSHNLPEATDLSEELRTFCAGAVIRVIDLQ